MMLQRETSYRTVEHPDLLRVGPLTMHLVDDPMVKRVREGDGLLGWAGDNRLALYVNPEHGAWEWWRLEANGEYAPVVAFDPAIVPWFELIAKSILWFQAHDQQAGFDPIEEMRKSEQERELRQVVERHEASVQLADAMQFDLRKANEIA
jgi:hypothetical protein